VLNKVTLYPIQGLEGGLNEAAFDRSALPIIIIESITIEDVSPMFTQHTFEGTKTSLGILASRELENIQTAIVHRYETCGADSGQFTTESQALVRNVAACLRLIRPMRQPASLICGELRNDGTLDVQSFELPPALWEVPEVQKLFDLRNRDAEMLQALGSHFLRAMTGEFWKFRMAVEFHEAGHFQGRYWKARFLLWCSGVEAVFTSKHAEHRGSRVAKERIKWFLGAATPLCDPGDLPNFLPQPNLTIADVVDDLYRVRNFVAHGDRVPDEYLQRPLRRGLNGDLPVFLVLVEAASYILRRSLLRILQNNLLGHFASAASAEAYFAAAGLTFSQITERQRGPITDDEE
jgi:hypothetical protein